MPQFDPTTFPPQLAWLAITFILLYLLMTRIALPRVAEVLEKRQDRIDDDLEKAAKLKAEAEETLAAYEKAMAEGRAKAQALLRQASQEMAEDSTQRHNALAGRLTKEIEEAERRIAAAKTEAIDNLRAVAVEAAEASTRRLIGVEPDRKAVDAAVDAAFKERS